MTHCIATLIENSFASTFKTGCSAGMVFPTPLRMISIPQIHIQPTLMIQKIYKLSLSAEMHFLQWIGVNCPNFLIILLLWMLWAAKLPVIA